MKEFILRSTTTGKEFSFTGLAQESSPDGREFVKSIQSSVNGNMYVQRLELERIYQGISVLIPHKDMSSFPVSSGRPPRGNYQDLVDFVNESVVTFVDWEDNEYENVVIVTADIQVNSMAPMTYPRFVQIEIIYRKSDLVIPPPPPLEKDNG